jgi:5-(carboxyamino)imidazole ribonucleotide synthase
MTLPPGSTIGILGGGQLGRMLSQAAAQLGFDVCVFTDETDSPAARVSAHTIVAKYDDEAALMRFAKRVQVVTTEFENVPANTAAILMKTGVDVRPHPHALAVAQDRFDEKSYLASAGITTPRFAAISSQDDLDAAIEDIGVPTILKTRRLGYDGRGQIRITTKADGAGAYEKLGAPGILEQFCPFEREVSIIGARSQMGEIAFYDICENEHKGGILSRTILPANSSAAVTVAAQDAAQRVLEAFGYVGVLTIELFVMRDGSVVANEMAPRVHNSGHWTIEGALTSQFEQHIRAIAGWPLGPTTRIADIEMLNLIGEDANHWSAYAADPSAHLHLYGKREVRPGRKMGHVTKLKLRELP